MIDLEEDRLMAIQQLADYLSVSERVIRRVLRQWRIGCAKVGEFVRFERSRIA